MSESFTIKGRIIVINELNHISDSFQKREFVLEVPDSNPQYTDLISLEFVKDKCSLLDQYQVGQEVEVGFNLKGRKWDGPKGTRYFNTLQAWMIKSVGQQAPPQAYQQAPVQNQLPPQNFDDGLEDSCPF